MISRKDDENYVELRLEFNRIRSNLKGREWETCINCGTDECIEIHHVVPLLFGGTNNIRNLVPLCHKCHCAIHYGKNIRDYQNKDISGRPRSCSKESAYDALDLYVNGKIGTQECKELMNLSQKSRITDNVVFKEFKKERGIKTTKNNIDILNAQKNGGVKEGMNVGFVVYVDGRTVVNYY